MVLRHIFAYIFSSLMPYTEEDEAYKNLFTLLSLLILTKSSNASKLIDLPKVGFNSKLGSFEIHAK